MVSQNNKFNFDLLLTSPQAPQHPKQPVVAQAGPKPDSYYGHKNTACLCAWFIMHLFVCPEYPPTFSGSNTKLPYFIAYALHWTKLHSSVTFTTLVLLRWLKARFPLLVAHWAIVCWSQCSWSPPRWSVMTPTLTSPGRSSARACSSFDGVWGVLISQLKAQRRAGCSQGVHRHGLQRLCWAWTLPHICASDHIKTCHHLHKPLRCHCP